MLGFVLGSVLGLTLLLPLVVTSVNGVACTDSITQLRHFTTGFELGVPLVIPSIDPAGIAYHEPSGHLFIADSEINEVSAAFDLVGANLFEISPDGETLYASYDLTVMGNNEPTGITYNAFDGCFYVTDDDAKTITRYAFSPAAGFAVDDVVETLSTVGVSDPEGITSDPATGLLYVADGDSELIIVYGYDEGGSGFNLQEILDLDALNAPSETPADPEGIAYDVDTGHLFVVSGPDDAVFEYTTAGNFVAIYDLAVLAPRAIAPHGLTFAPTSHEGDNPLRNGLFFADGLIDNNQHSEERDGAVYEVLVGVVQCPWELNADGIVGIVNLLELIGAWGCDPGGPTDFNGNGSVDFTDMLMLVAGWGDRPLTLQLSGTVPCSSKWQITFATSSTTVSSGRLASTETNRRLVSRSFS